MRLNNMGNQKESGECIEQENDEGGDRERERTEEPTHRPSHLDSEQLGFYLFIFMQRNARLSSEGFMMRRQSIFLPDNQLPIVRTARRGALF